MLKPVALFINGVFDTVLQEILEVQSVLPEQIMFLQPFSGSAMTVLRDDPPAIDAPMRLFVSITIDLANVHYEAEIVGWEDKRTMPEAKKQVVKRLIDLLQPDEGGLYDASKGGTGESVNLLYVRRLRKLEPPFSVSQLQKVRGGEPLSTGRTTAGGWSYVQPEMLAQAAT